MYVCSYRSNSPLTYCSSCRRTAISLVSRERCVPMVPWYQVELHGTVLCAVRHSKLSPVTTHCGTAVSLCGLTHTCQYIRQSTSSNDRINTTANSTTEIIVPISTPPSKRAKQARSSKIGHHQSLPLHTPSKAILSTHK